jgi:PAB-dependent poly(A)-specific ribonuclease subunit 2
MVLRIVTKDDRSHLVAVVRVPEEEEHPDPENSGWVLFNDFAVRRITEIEAVSFVSDWKVRLVGLIVRFNNSL